MIELQKVANKSRVCQLITWRWKRFAMLLSAEQPWKLGR
jgi:hypothetical protein